MLTRRGFLGTLAAVAASRVAPVSVAAAAPVPVFAPLPSIREVESACYILTHEGPFILTEDGAKSMSLTFDRVPRRDDGDTILELR